MAHSVLKSALRIRNSHCCFTRPTAAYSWWYHYSNHRNYASFHFVQKANKIGFLTVSTSTPGVDAVPLTNCNYSTSIFETAEGRDYLTMTDEKLLSQCEMDTFKAAGPGGQHRNKRESAVRLRHLPTGIIAQVHADGFLFSTLSFLT